MKKDKKTVLIVDDQNNWRNLFRELLEAEFEVTDVDSYNEALKTISKRKSPFHVVITDIRLVDASTRNEDGLRLAEKIKKSKDFTELIIVTGYPTIETSKRAVGPLHAFEYLEKYPLNGEFNPYEFQKIVRKAAEEANQKRQIEPTSQKVDVFVLMPFAEQYRAFYEDVIKKTLENMNLVCKRADDFFESSVIMNDIMQCIYQAEIIIADFSGRSPNVFFEVGIAHALGKSVILITQDLEDVPPRLQIVRCHIYKDDLDSAKKLPKVLRNAIRDVQGKTRSIFPKMKNTRLNTQVCLALMPSNERGEQIFNNLILDVVKKLKLECIRAEEIFDSNSVLDQMWEKINKSTVIITDLTDRDPDVFYLAGLAFGLNKRILFMTQQKENIPFDLKKGSSLIYSLKTYAEGKSAKDKLKNSIEQMLKD